AFPAKINPPDLLRTPFPLGFAPPLELGEIAGDVILQMHPRPLADAQRRKTVPFLHFLDSFQVDPDHLIAETLLDLQSSLIIGKSKRSFINIRFYFLGGI